MDTDSEFCSYSKGTLTTFVTAEILISRYMLIPASSRLFVWAAFISRCAGIMMKRAILLHIPTGYKSIATEKKSIIHTPLHFKIESVKNLILGINCVRHDALGILFVPFKIKGRAPYHMIKLFSLFRLPIGRASPDDASRQPILVSPYLVSF